MKKKQKKPHAIWEWLIKPYAMNMVEFVYGKEQKRNFRKII